MRMPWRNFCVCVCARARARAVPMPKDEDLAHAGLRCRAAFDLVDHCLLAQRIQHYIFAVMLPHVPGAPGAPGAPHSTTSYPWRWDNAWHIRV
uniref:Putative secreted protein n=1 Tax=Anopheles triannulatus TaxID=58253 RepID=A0A2M4B728_9DIPT